MNLSPINLKKSFLTFFTIFLSTFSIAQSILLQEKFNTSYFESLKFYYDLHTSDLYLVSGVQKKYLKFDDHIGLALGVKLQIRRK